MKKHIAQLSAIVLAITLAGCTASSDPLSSDPQTPSPQPTSGGANGGPMAPAPPDSSLSQEQFDQLMSAFAASGNTAGQVDLVATTDYENGMIQHLDTIWSNWFASEGYPEPWVGVKLIQPGEIYTSNCPVPISATEVTYSFGSDFPNAFYCPLDMNSSDRGYLIIPIQTMAKMWTGDIFQQQVSDLKYVGDFAAAMITAHEFGHHIQDELTENTGIAAPAKPGVELIADCFAGVWTYSLNLDGRLEAGDVDEALNALAIIGDNQGDHGTGAERDNAFSIGLYGSQADPRGGVPLNCTKAFWPAFPSA